MVGLEMIVECILVRETACGAATFGILTFVTDRMELVGIGHTALTEEGICLV
jgi:hypothetical protein